MKTNVFIEKLKESLEMEDIDMSTDTDLKSIKGYDSLAVLSIIALTDEEFEKKLTAGQLKSVTTVQSLMELIGIENFEN